MAKYDVRAVDTVDGAVENVLQGVGRKRKAVCLESWPVVTRVGVTWILLLGLGVDGCAEYPSKSALSSWTKGGVISADVEQDMRECRQGAVSPDVINSKGLVVRRATVSEERVEACMTSRGYTWTRP